MATRLGLRSLDPRREENQTMPVYKVFTWNIQRAQSVSRQGAMIRERYRVLKALVDWADFGFITEPGRDIRNNLNNDENPTTAAQDGTSYP